MKRKLEISELIFKIVSYVFLTIFAVCCLYPFLYAISASVSGRDAVEYGQIVLLPKDIQFDAFAEMFNNNMFWNAYTGIDSSPGPLPATGCPAPQPSSVQRKGTIRS